MKGTLSNYYIIKLLSMYLDTLYTNLCSMSVQNRSTTDNALVSQKGRCLISWFLQSTCFPWAMLSAALELASIAMRMTPNSLFL